MRQAPEPGEEGAFHPLGANPGDFFIEGDDDWWEIATQPRKREHGVDHFATFPDELARRMVLVGTPEWVCKKCGMARVRVTGIPYDAEHPTYNEWRKEHQHGDKYPGGTRPDNSTGFGATVSAYYDEVWGDRHTPRQMLGWTTCSCVDEEGKHPGWRPGVVLDPFMGRGTVCVIAKRYGRDYIGIDLKSEYVEMALGNLTLEPDPLSFKLDD